MMGDLGITRMRRCPRFTDPQVKRVGEDVLVTAYL